ncbi:hypothetical protein ACS0TY_010571 [Phlomoides rotata]
MDDQSPTQGMLATTEEEPMELNVPQDLAKCEDLEPILGFEPVELDLDPRGQIHDSKGDKRTAPIEELEHILIDPARPELKVTIGSQVPTKMWGEMIDFLKKNIDVFAWSHGDMMGIDLRHACHHLKIDPKRKPVS